MEITKYLIILWRRKWLILTTTLMAIIVAVAGTSLLTPKYESSVLLRLSTTTRGSPDWIDFDLQYADRMMNTYRVFATSSAVQNEVVERLSLPGRPAVEVEILANTELMRISVRDTNPWRAAATANSVAAVLIEEIMVLSETEQRGTRERASNLLSQFESELARL
jgi:capsular polysaccharide biosynthesis protein